MNGKERHSSCRRYQLDVVRNLSAQGLVPGVDVNVTELNQEDCLDGWIYSKDIYQSTLVSEVGTFHYLLVFFAVFLQWSHRKLCWGFSVLLCLNYIAYFSFIAKLKSFSWISTKKTSKCWNWQSSWVARWGRPMIPIPIWDLVICCYGWQVNII